MLWQKVVEMTKAYQIWAKRCIVEPYTKQKKRNKKVVSFLYYFKFIRVSDSKDKNFKKKKRRKRYEYSVK